MLRGVVDVHNDALVGAKLFAVARTRIGAALRSIRQAHQDARSLHGLLLPQMLQHGLWRAAPRRRAHAASESAALLF